MRISVIVALLVLVALAGCQYLKPALAPVDCASGVVDATDKAPTLTGAATLPLKEEAPEKSRDGIPVKTVTEGQLVSFPNLKATDPDGDKLTYTFSSPLNSSGMWQTKLGDAGEYKVLITASDGKAQTKQDVIVKVLAGNKVPIIELVDAKVKEGEQVTLAPKVSDPDGDKLTVSYSGWMTTNTKKTTFTDAGVYNVTVTADDGKNGKVSKTIKVTVEDVNRAPLLSPMQDLAVKEGDKIQLSPKAVDPDGDKLAFEYSKPFDSTGTWQTKRGDEGVHKASITATDTKGLKATSNFIVAVESSNLAPVISGPSEIKAKEGETLNLAALFTVTDEEKDAVTVSYSGWMTSSTKQLSHSDAGTHEVVITADDKNNAPVAKKVAIVVSDVNRAPTFDSGSFE